MEKKFRITLLKTLSTLGISFMQIQEHKKAKNLSYTQIYNVLKGTTPDKNQRVLDATLAVIEQKKREQKEVEEKIKSVSQ